MTEILKGLREACLPREDLNDRTLGLYAEKVEGLPGDTQIWYGDGDLALCVESNPGMGVFAEPFANYITALVNAHVSDVEKALGGWVPEPRTKANIEERLAVLARCAVEYDCAQPDAGAVALFWRFYDLFPALFCAAGIFCGDDGSIEVVVTDDPARVEMIFSKHPLPSPPKETA